MQKNQQREELEDRLKPESLTTNGPHPRFQGSNWLWFAEMKTKQQQQKKKKTKEHEEKRGEKEAEGGAAKAIEGLLAEEPTERRA